MYRLNHTFFKSPSDCIASRYEHAVDLRAAHVLPRNHVGERMLILVGIVKEFRNLPVLHPLCIFQKDAHVLQHMLPRMQTRSIPDGGNEPVVLEVVLNRVWTITGRKKGKKCFCFATSICSCFYSLVWDSLNCRRRLQCSPKANLISGKRASCKP